MNPYVSCLLALFALQWPAAARAADVDFAAELLNSADNNIVIETSNDDVLVFKDGLYDLKGKALTIIAPRSRAEGIAIIRSFDPAFRPATVEGAPPQVGPGAGGGEWGCVTREIPFPIAFGGGGFKVRSTTCNEHGQQGPQGSEGGVGQPGLPAGAISLQIGAIDGAGRIVVIGNGQSGGQGQQGGQGGNGGRGRNGDNRGGDAFCSNARTPTNGGNGGTGGTGGTGGVGGPGGAGATIVINAALQEATGTYETIDLEWLKSIGEEAKIASQKILASAPGGSGGNGGTPGIPGNPAGGGDAGKRSHCGGGSDPGRVGAPGSQGSTGAVGSIGAAGVIRFE